VKIVQPTRLLAEAADVLGPVFDAVVVVGATALEVALAEASIAITPTRDVDVVVPVGRAREVVGLLEAADMEPSDQPHERGFTWIRGDLKVQLVRTFHPFPGPVAKFLPENSAFGMAADPASQLMVAFADDPQTPRLLCVNAGGLLALKEAAFGRTRATEDTPAERDFHDAYLLVSEVPDAVVNDLAVAGYEVEKRASRAIAQLADGGGATQAAARQMVRLRAVDTQREGEAAVRRAAVRIQRRIAAA
jgi:hypothetical protein